MPCAYASHSGTPCDIWSCFPTLLFKTCAVRRDAATGEVRIGIFSTRDIREDEELTYDYMFEHYGLAGMAQGFQCQCGAKNCR